VILHGLQTERLGCLSVDSGVSRHLHHFRRHATNSLTLRFSQRRISRSLLGQSRLTRSSSRYTRYKGEPLEEQEPVNKELTDLLKRAFEATAGEDRLAELGALGSQINKISPFFDPRNYGHKKLLLLVRDAGLFEVQEIPGKQNQLAKVVYIKNSRVDQAMLNLPWNF
jgi:hypothetical protein